MDFTTLINDKDFQGLPPEEQTKVLNHALPDFAGLPDEEKQKVLGRIPKEFLAPPPPDTAFRQDRPIRQMASRAYTPILEGMGMVAGTPGFAAGPGTGLASVASGFGIGKETAKNIDEAIGLPVERPKTIPGAGLSALETMKEGAQFELGGRAMAKGLTAIPKAINWLGTYFASDTPAFTKEAERIAMEAGFKPTAAERTASSALSKMEKVLRWFPTSGGEFTKRDAVEALKWVRWREELIAGTGGKAAPGVEAVDRAVNAGVRLKSIVDKYVNEATIADAGALEGARNSILKALGSSEGYTALGKTAQQMKMVRNRAAAQKAEAIYGIASKHLSPEDKVIPTNLMRTSEEILKEQNAIPPSERDISLIKRLQDYAGGGLPEESIKGMEGFTMKEGKIVKAGFEPGYTWESTKRLKGLFRKRIEDGDTAIKRDIGGMKFMSSPEAGIYKRLQSALGADIKAFAKEKGGEFERATRVADRFYKSRVGFYNDPDVIKMSLEDPEFLFDMVSGSGATTVPQKFRKAVGPKVFDQFKRKLTNRLFGMDKPGPFNPDAVSTTLGKYGETLNEFYTPREIEQMAEAVNVGRGVIAKGIETNKFFIELLKRDSTRVIGGQHLGEASQPIVGFIVRHDNIPMLRRLEPILGKQEMNNVRATWLSNIIDKNRFGLVQPTQLTKLLKTFGEDTLEAFLGKDATTNLIRMEKVATVQKTVEELARNPSGTAQGLMTYFTALRTAGALAEGSLWGVIKNLWPPHLLAKVYLSETGTKLLTGTWQLQASTEAAARAHTILWSIAIKNEFDATMRTPPIEEEK